MRAKLSQFWIAAFCLFAVPLSQAYAQSNGVDGVAINGTSKVTELSAFTTIIVTVAELCEDYIFPVGAIVVLGVSFWSLFFRRDIMQFATGLFVAIGLGASSFFMESIMAAFTS